MTNKTLQRQRIAPIPLSLLAWFALAWSWTLSTDSLELSGSRAEGIVVAAIVSIINTGLSAWIIWKALGLARSIFKARPNWQAPLLGLGLFAATDFLVAWLTAIIWIGPQGRKCRQCTSTQLTHAATHTYTAWLRQ